MTNEQIEDLNDAQRDVDDAEKAVRDAFNWYVNRVARLQELKDEAILENEF